MPSLNKRLSFLVFWVPNDGCTCMNVSFYSLKCQNTSDRILIDNGLQYVLYTCASPLPVSACLVQKSKYM